MKENKTLIAFLFVVVVVLFSEFVLCPGISFPFTLSARFQDFSRSGKQCVIIPNFPLLFALCLVLLSGI